MITRLKNILVIDDDAATVFLNKWIVDSLNFQGDFLAAANGEEALNILNFSKTPSEPYLIILDINMPIMNGWEFLAHYQHLNHRKELDTIILMLSDDAETQRKLITEQYPFVAGYQQKPMGRTQLKSLIESYS